MIKIFGFCATVAKQYSRNQPCVSVRFHHSLFSGKSLKLRDASKDNISSVLKSKIGCHQCVLNRRNYNANSYFAFVADTRPVLCAQDLLINVHSSMNIPWWLTIIICTSMIRTFITFPLTVYQHQILAKYQNIQSELVEIANELRKETAVAIKFYHWSEKQARIAFTFSFRKHKNDVIVRENCHPMKGTLVMIFQIPIWISLSFALRSISLDSTSPASQLVYSELCADQFLWIPNLALPDPYVILPVSLAVINLCIVELHALRFTGVPTKFQKFVNNTIRGFSVLMVPLAMSMPSCVVLYWTTSSLLGLVQNFILIFPQVRRVLRIPKTQQEMEAPVKNIILKLRQRFNL